MRKIQAAVAAALCVLVWLAGVGVSAAHTDLASSEPADGSISTSPIESVTFVFTGPIEPFSDGFTLTTLDGTDLPIEAVDMVDEATVAVTPAVPITQPVAATWAIVSRDSHPVTGTILFAVDAATPTTEVETSPVPVAPPPTPSEPSTPAGSATTAAPATPDPGLEGAALSTHLERTSAQENLEQLRAAQRDTDRAQATADLVAGLVRWLGYVTTAIALGGLALALLADRDDTVVWDHGGRVVAGSVVVLGASTLLMIGAQLAVLTGRPTDIAAVDRWGEVFSGRFQTGILVRLAGVAVLALGAIGARRRRTATGFTGSSLVLGSFLLLGHQSGTGSAWLTVPGTIVHLAAVSVWVGGLVALWQVARRSPGPRVRLVTATFSRMAATALAATVVAGLALTAARLGAVDELWTTSFGQRLSVKLAIVAFVVGLGAMHRFRTVPEIEASNGRDVTWFLRAAGLEVVGFAAVLGLTAWLVAGTA